MFGLTTPNGRASHGRVAATTFCRCGAVAAVLLAGGERVCAQVLVPSPGQLYMNAFHANLNNGTGLADGRGNSFDVLTNGIVNHGNPRVDNVDTWGSDDLGVINDFVGFSYDSPHRFDSITVEVGHQFVDGGDWETMPRVFILKNRTLVGDSVEPDLSPNWVEVFGATETAGHVFTPIVNFPAAGTTIQLDLSSISEADRTGWGWAVGGVDGNQNASDIYHFISLTEAFAQGVPAQAPTISAPATPEPVNIVSNSYNSVARNGDGLIAWRGQAFASVTNGNIVHDAADDGFDTFQGDSAGTLTDFVGLQYGNLYEFDSLTVELANQFPDGGDWEETPRIFILRNPVDTNQTPPEDDPANWMEVTGAVETTGHIFDPIVVPGPGGTINFDLTAVPLDQRRGWGWAVGGVDGNQNDAGVVNFISVTELSATGSLIEGPTDLNLEVNTSTGEVRIVNNAAFDIDFDFYRVESDAGSLDIGSNGWNSFEDPTLNPSEFPAGDGTGNGWENLGTPSNNEVAEAFLSDVSTLASGGFVSLGNLFGGDTQDLTFRYRGVGGNFVDALVTEIMSSLDGDYNADGVVNAADYTVWRDSLGTNVTLPNDTTPGMVTQIDYNVWAANFGAGSGSSAEAVPEPGAIALVGSLVLLGTLLCRTR